MAGKNYVLATKENAINKTYPVVRPLYYYYQTSKEKQVKPFVDFHLVLRRSADRRRSRLHPA